MTPLLAACEAGAIFIALWVLERTLPTAPGVLEGTSLAAPGFLIEIEATAVVAG